jgi:protein arginine N-methyltransferase 1
MLDSVIFARDKWLKPQGSLLPNKATMYIAAMDDEKYYNKRLVNTPIFRIFGTTYTVYQCFA